MENRYRVAVVFTLVLAGCGGGSGNDPGAATAVSSARLDAPASSTAATPASSATAGNAEVVSATNTPSAASELWPVSQLLTRGLSQPYGNRAITASAFNQTAAVSPTGGMTDGRRGGVWHTWSWRTSDGRLAVDRFQAFGADTLSSCEGQGLALPMSARVGESGDALQCQQSTQSDGVTSVAPLTLRWSVVAGDQPGSVQVCLTRYGCVRGDASGNLDDSVAPWNSTDETAPSAEGLAASEPPAQMNAAWSLRNMVENIREGQVFYLGVHQRWSVGQTSPALTGDRMKVTGREYPDGSKGLEFGDLQTVFSLRIRLAHFGIARWSIRDGNAGYDEVTEAFQGANAAGFFDPGLLNGLSGTSGYNAILPAVAASRSPSLQTEFGIFADDAKACLSSARVTPVGATNFSFCWAHEPSEALFAVSRGRAGQDIYATSLGFLTR